MIFEGIKISVESFHHRQVSKLLMAVAIFSNDPKHAVKINSSSHKKYKPPRAIIYDEITLQVIFYVQSSVAWIWVLLCSWKNVMAIIKEYGLNNALNVPCSVFRSISCWLPVSEQFPGGFKFLALSRYHFFYLFFLLIFFSDTISLDKERNGGEKWYLLLEQLWMVSYNWKA